MPANALLRAWVSVEVAGRSIMRMGVPSAPNVGAPENISITLLEVRPAASSTPGHAATLRTLAYGIAFGPTKRSVLRHAMTRGDFA